MAKKSKPVDPPPSVAAWMATWSDMMNLLMCFFVMLFAMSSVDAGKFEIFAISMASRTTFSIFEGGGSAADSGGMLVGNGASQLHDLGILFESTGFNPDGSMMPDGLQSGADETMEEAQAQEIIEQMKMAASEDMAENIAEALYERSLDGLVDIEFNAQYVMLRMSGAILFDSGSVELKPDAQQILSQVALIIQRYAQGMIQIEGHTDNVPMGGSGRYRNNDELSGGRALSVFEYLMENTVLPPRQVVHAGRGEHDPLVSNDTAEGRAVNRRVEIKLFNSLSSY
jgi:chemotaxis protein MotB